MNILIVLVAGGIIMFTVGLARADFQMGAPDKPTGGRAEIIGGTPQDPDKWPATRFFKFRNKVCTSTVIGPRAVITAAHCVDDNSVGTIKFDEFETTVRCRQHSSYRNDSSLDIALCLADDLIVLPSAGKFERINKDVAKPGSGQRLTLLGYGCRRQGGGGPTGTLWGGPAVVGTQRSGAYILTFGGAAVCYGDSGGAAYLPVGLYRRAIVAIASRGDVSAQSDLTHLAHPSVLEFVRTWSTSTAAKICGYNETSADCHD